MKLIRTIALILAVIGSFGDCMPPTQKPDSPAASSEEKKEEVFIKAGDPNGVLWLTREDFDHQVKQKFGMYDKLSAEKRFLDVLVRVIAVNSEIFKEICNYEQLCKNVEAIAYKFFIVTESDSEGKGQSLKFRMIELFKFVSPSYELVEPLYHLLSGMSANTKINPNSLNRVCQEAGKVDRIYRQFVELFKGFPLKSYISQINELREAINNPESEPPGGFLLLRKFADILTPMDAQLSEIRETLDKAIKMNFTTLLEATNAIYSVAVEALNDNGASSSK